MSVHLYIPLSLRDSYAFLSSDENTDTCILFVHGFWGGAFRTWEHFQDLSDDLAGPMAEVLARADLFFYDYPASKNFLDRSAEQLGKFLLAIFPSPSRTLFDPATRNGSSVTDPLMSGGHCDRINVLCWRATP